jgi:predicted nucleic acid-binding protein
LFDHSPPARSGKPSDGRYIFEIDGHGALGRQLGPELIQVAVMHDAAMIDHDNPLAEALDISQIAALAHYSELDVEQYMEYLRHMAEIDEITDVISGAATHHEDDRILATAVLGAVDFLATGDKQLLALNNYRGVSIDTPRYFVEQYLHE